MRGADGKIGGEDEDVAGRFGIPFGYKVQLV